MLEAQKPGHREEVTIAHAPSTPSSAKGSSI